MNDEDRFAGLCEASRMAIAAVERETAELEASFGPDTGGRPAASRPSRPGSTNSSSVVFTLRLAREDMATLTRRGAYLQVPPSVLARNLIRSGLQRPDTSRQRTRDPRVDELVSELGSTLTRLRLALGEL